MTQEDKKTNQKEASPATVGRIHSIETLGALDGPGLRTVVFLQGCPLRCAYCHNPDTWKTGGGNEITAENLVEKIKRYKPYYRSDGGVTLSGGEPLLQGDFCAEVARLCAEHGIQVALDTSGYILHKEAVNQAGLILLDIKHTDRAAYKKLTKVSLSKTIEFLDYCKEIQKPLWIRQVILPGINDTRENILALKELIRGANVKKTELLPYHTMGVDKWAQLGLEYTLEGVSPPSQEKMDKLYAILNEG